MHAVPDPETLAAIGRVLRDRHYAFVCPTPATIDRVRARPQGPQPGLRDILGWNRPFTEDALDAELFGLLRHGGLLAREGPRWRSRVRFSTIGGLLVAHSAYPTDENDAVFLGPDTYRFAGFVQRALHGWQPPQRPVRILDLGCGSGAGGLVAAAACGPGPVSLTLADINPRALAFSRANAALAERPATVVHSDLFGALEGPFDLIVVNPPYLCDGQKRLYRHGGGANGLELPIKMVEASFAQLRAGGLLLAYTGTPVIDGQDPFRAAVQHLADTCRTFSYEETDPDIFGEELENPAYATADRIAAIALTIER